VVGVSVAQAMQPRLEQGVDRYWGLLWAGGSLEPWTNIVSRTDTAAFGRFV
jgi:hypothetical protein